MNMLLIMLNTPARYIFEDFFLALIWLGLFTAVFFAYYYFLKARNEERMAMIEKGNDLSELYKAKPKRNFRFPWYKLIVTIMFIGIGGFIGMITAANLEGNFKHFDTEPLIFLIILFFGAIGMLIGHFFDVRQRKIEKRLDD